MARFTRVSVIDTDDQLAGLFFTRLALAECQAKKTPVEFEGVEGEWVPSGGTDYVAFGANSWCSAPVTLGDMVEVAGDD